VNEIILLEQEIMEIWVGNMSANIIITVITRLNNADKIVETIKSVRVIFFIMTDFVALMYLFNK
jgi:hypothetical protein